jgi:hypothetical protein
MKKILLFFLLTLLRTFSFSQAANDDCTTATDVGVLTLDTIWMNCYMGIPSTHPAFSVRDSNDIATPSLPYYYMSGCYGYDTATTSLADDVWFKFRSTASNVRLYFSSWDTLDTIHVNLYHGTTCTTLQPSACWTFLYSMSIFYIDYYCSNDTINQYNYIQVSGTAPGQAVKFEFCITALDVNTIGAYGTININTGIEKYSTSNFSIYPSPTHDSFIINYAGALQIFNTLGTSVYQTTLTSKHQTLNPNLPAGIYFVRVSDGEKVYTQKLVLE